MKLFNVILFLFFLLALKLSTVLVDKSFQSVAIENQITFYKISLKENKVEKPKSFEKIKELALLLNAIEAKFAQKQTRVLPVKRKTIKKPIVKNLRNKNEKIKINRSPSVENLIAKRSIKSQIIELSIKSPIKEKTINERFTVSLTAFSHIKYVLPSSTDLMSTQTIIAKTKIEEKYNDKSLMDRISIAQAASEKSNQPVNIKKAVIPSPRPLIKTTKDEDDLVFFSYSEPKPEQKNKNSELNLAQPSVVSNQVVKKITKPSSLSVKNDYSKLIQTAMNSKLKPETNNKVENNQGPATASFVSSSVTSDSRIILSAHSVDFKSSPKIVYDYRVEFHDDIYEKANSDKEGYVSLENTINGEYSTRRISVVGSDYLTMTTELIYENGDIPFQIPLISRHDFINLMNKRNINDNGAGLLIELDENTEQVDIDSNYSAKLYLDKNYKIVTPESADYFYVFYIGLEPGNRVLSYKTNVNNRTVDRIIHLRDSEIFFDKNYFAKEELHRVSFFEENLMGTTRTPLSISEKEFKKMIGDVKISQDSLNSFKLINGLTALGSRKYYVLSHLKEKVYLGSWNKESVIIPSESYMRYVITDFEDYNNQNCMIQINLEKKAKQLLYNGDTGTSNLGIKARILDSDGILYKDLSDESRRIFLKGDLQGIVNIKITYVDDTVDYLHSYCSESSYLIEQL